MGESFDTFRYISYLLRRYRFIALAGIRRRLAHAFNSAGLMDDRPQAGKRTSETLCGHSADIFREKFGSAHPGR